MGDGLNVLIRSSHSKSMPEREVGVVYVGKRRAMSYAVAAILALMAGGKVTLKARGSNISTAVSAEEIVRRRLAGSLVLERVEIGEEALERDGRRRMVSTMEITLRMAQAVGKDTSAVIEGKPVEMKPAKKGKQPTR